MKEILAEKEILALWKKFPKLKIYLEAYSDEAMVSKLEEYQKAVRTWYLGFVPKLEAFLEDHVSRAQIQKLIEEFPKEKDFMPTSNVGSFKPLELLSAIYEWKKRLEAVIEK